MNAAARLDLDLHLTDRDISILADLEQYRLLTTRQLQRLHLPAKPFGAHATASAATRGTTRILNRLESLGTVARLERRIGGTKHGSALTIWHLAAAGERFLRLRRGDLKRRRYVEPTLTFTAHTLAVADVAVQLREHAHVGTLELLELDTEPHCWRTFHGAGASVLTLKPDLLVVTADETTETHSFVEVDRGTEHPNTVLRKCRLYQQYQRTGTEQAARGLFPAVVWIVPTPKRMAALRDAIDGDRTLDPDLFWVTVSEAALRQLAPYDTTVT